MTTEKEENIEKNTKKKLRTWRKSGKNRDRCIGRKKAQRLKRIKKSLIKEEGNIWIEKKKKKGRKDERRRRHADEEKSLQRRKIKNF